MPLMNVKRGSTGKNVAPVLGQDAAAGDPGSAVIQPPRERCETGWDILFATHSFPPLIKTARLDFASCISGARWQHQRQRWWKDDTCGAEGSDFFCFKKGRFWNPSGKMCVWPCEGFCQVFFLIPKILIIFKWSHSSQVYFTMEYFCRTLFTISSVLSRFNRGGKNGVNMQWLKFSIPWNTKRKQIRHQGVEAHQWASIKSLRIRKKK